MFCKASSCFSTHKILAASSIVRDACAGPAWSSIRQGFPE